MKKIFIRLINLFRPDSFFVKYVRKLIVLKEIIIVFYLIKIRKIKSMNIVFDCKISPGTYGDFMEMIMLVRLFEALKLKTQLIIISGEYRNNWSHRYKASEIKTHINSIKKLAKNLFLNKNTAVFDISWEKFNYLLKEEKLKFILFKRKVKRRRAVYTHAINFLNYAVFNKNKLQKKILFKKKEIKIRYQNENNLPKKYLTLHCRHGTNGIKKPSNITKSNFVKIIKKLNEVYPKYKVVIVSDKIGSNYFKKIAKINFLKCIFSKDFSDNFLTDGKVILNSKGFFSFKGGGITLFATYSRLPFLRVDPFYPNFFSMQYLQYQWSNLRMCPWFKDNQVWIRGGNEKLFLNKIKEIKVNE